MDFLRKKIGPVFIKEESDVSEYITKLKELSEKAISDSTKEEVEKQLKLAMYGEAGEKSIAFELKNSNIDMLILHDIYLEVGELSAQIDYLIITRKRVYVLECKNLIGNIEIDNAGRFIRTYEINGKKYREGIYSPITQNERHLTVLKELRKSSKNNIITKYLFEKNFDEAYKSLVVLANSKTYLNDRYAKKEVKSQVIRADQIINTIKDMEEDTKLSSMNEKEMREFAEFFLSSSKPNKSDYAKKYDELVKLDLEQQLNTANSTTSKTTDSLCPKCGKKLVIRTATKGDNAGNQFWGCTGFPYCRYIHNI